MLLVYPPVSKPCEPPAGVARIAGALRRSGAACRVLDANIEGIDYLLGIPADSSSDTWTKRAARHRTAHLHALRSPGGYRNPDRYRRSVADVNRVLEIAGGAAAGRGSARVSLVNYADSGLSPLRSGDLLRAAERPELNPFYPYLANRLPSLMDKDGSGVAGLSVCFLSQALTAFAAVGIIRRLDPAVKIVIGGGLVTSWMSRPGWKNPFGGLVDEVVAGAGEEPLLELLGKTPRQRDFPPDYGFCGPGAYLAPGLVLPYSASTGCYWGRCTFCPERAEGRSYRAASPGRVLKELERLVREFKPCLVHFLDNAMSPALLDRIAAAGLGAPWYGFVRVDSRLGDPDFCRALRASGCVMLQLGIESGDQEVLDRLDKGIRVGDASRALRTLKAAGIGTYVYLLFGTPPETPDSAGRTLRFTAEHHESIDFLNTALFNMPAHGPDAADHAPSTFYDADLTLYTGFSHPDGWNRAEVRDFLQSRFARHPAISPIIRRDPPTFTSSHAPFFIRR